MLWILILLLSAFSLPVRHPDPRSFTPPPLPTPASSVTHTRSEVEFVHCVHCVHFSPLLNLEPVFPVTRLLPLHRNFWAVGARERTKADKVKKFFFMCRFSHIYNVSVLHTCVCNFLYIKCSDFLTFHGFVLFFFRSCPAPVFPIYDLIFLSYVRLRSFGSMIRSNFGSSVLCPVQR